MKAVRIVDPTQQEDRGRAWFGATVTVADDDDNERTVTLVGEDEADARRADQLALADGACLRGGRRRCTPGRSARRRERI
jgi:hypothetical protein